MGPFEHEQVQAHFRMLAELGEIVADAHQRVTELVRHELRVVEAQTTGDRAAVAEAEDAAGEARRELDRTLDAISATTGGRPAGLVAVGEG